MQAGDIVVATAGKDRGKRFVVLSVDDRYAHIANGRRRRVQQPKKKSQKHLQIIGICDDAVQSALRQGRITNKILRKCLPGTDTMSGTV